MFMQSIEIKNFRAIKHALVKFDESIVIIGENDSGKSSVLDALNVALTQDETQLMKLALPQAYYHATGQAHPIGPIHIRIGFIEKERGEWNRDFYRPIQDLLGNNRSEKRMIFLEMEAELIGKELSLTLKIADKHGLNSSSDSDKINWLKRTNPVIHLTPGLLSGYGIDHISTPKQVHKPTSFPPHLHNAVTMVEYSASRLLRAKTADMIETLDQGYHAALQLNEYLRTLPAFDGIKIKLGADNSGGDASQHLVKRSGSTSQKLGALLIMAALLRGCGQTALHEVDPIWIIEDPEAHLHKITLASVAEILSGIKGQKILTTNSGALLSTIPLNRIRRLVRKEGMIHAYQIKADSLNTDETRRINYHVRTHRNASFYSRLWLLVEGETEFWLLPKFAQAMGYQFPLEGISVVEYAQSGLRPLLLVAKQLGINCIVLSDGDKAGRTYAKQAAEFLDKKQIFYLPAKDIENYLWLKGYAGVYMHYANINTQADRVSPTPIINRAVKRCSKPQVALGILDALQKADSPGVPHDLQKLIRLCVQYARN